MITVHHLNNSRSQRVLWLLEELGIAYEIKQYQRDAKTMLAPPELARVHPLGKSPVITDDGITVAESGAIIEYLLETYGAGRLRRRRDAETRRRYTLLAALRRRLGDAAAAAEADLRPHRAPAPMPFFVKPIARGIAAKVKRRSSSRT